nr:hypothetical protein 74 [Pelagibacteraceae bacterium]
MTKIQLKRSNVLDGGNAKEPSPAQMEYGELAVNYNNSDPSLFIKDSNDQIVKIAGESSASSPDVGDGTITITQPGTTDQTFTVNQSGNTTINLKNDNTVVTPGNGALTIRNYGDTTNSTGSFTANQSGNSTVTLPQIAYSNISGRPTIPSVGNGRITVKQPGTTDQSFTVNQSGDTVINLKNDNTVPSVGNGTITIKQPGTTDQSFTVNQTGNTTINLKNDNTVTSPGNGALTIRTFGESKNATGSFTANQGSGSIITLPQIRYRDLSETPPIPSVGNGTITITQPGTTNQTFTVNQSGNTTIALRNDNTNTTYSAGNGIAISSNIISVTTPTARTNINNSFTGRQTFTRISCTDNLRLLESATIQAFDPDTDRISTFDYNSIDVNGSLSTTSGGGVRAYLNSQLIDMNGGTNSLNIFPSGYKSTPKFKRSFGNYAHVLLQSFDADSTAALGSTVNQVYGVRVNKAAMSGSTKNYSFSTDVDRDGNKNYAVFAAGTAPSYFKGDVASDGSIGFSGRFNVRMDADNPASYTTTYTTEKDEDLNDIQVAQEEYTGPTEDLATMIKTVRSRLLAIESNSVSSESGNSALFDLLTDLSDRVAALEAA